ncbi:MAG TPA: hypothetical protein PKN48_03370 [Bacteroidales bacterium]|nr:hypothetical protein [Bacteroidales bacterium]
MLINLFKELKALVDQLNSKNETLQAELDEIKKMLNNQGQK